MVIKVKEVFLGLLIFYFVRSRIFRILGFSGLPYVSKMISSKDLVGHHQNYDHYQNSKSSIELSLQNQKRKLHPTLK